MNLKLYVNETIFQGQNQKKDIIKTTWEISATKPITMNVLRDALLEKEEYSQKGVLRGKKE